MKKTTLFSLALAAGLALSPVLADAQSKVTLTTANEVGSEFSFATNPGTVSVDWGDGTAVEVTSTGEPIKGDLKGQTVTITSDLLTFLDCSENQLTDLNISDASDLKALYCSDNKLRSLNVTCRNLEYLDCSGNEISGLSLILLQNLHSLDCSNNNLSVLTLTYQKELETLICSDNKLSALVTTSATKLKTLWCQNNSLKSLNLNSNTQLESLVCDNNEISSMNAANCRGLIDFWCDNNKLESVDVNSTKLETFSCSNNAISSLSLPALASWNKGLAFYCDGNNLTFASMHSVSNILDESNYWYAPQNEFALSSSTIKVGESISIPDMTKNLDGESVYPSYEWKNGDEVLEKGSKKDYTSRLNTYAFMKPFDSIYCEVTSSEYPGITLKSSPLAVVSTGTGIQDIMDSYGFSYISNNGIIRMKSEKPYRVNIYTVDGKQVWSGTVINEESVSLGHGIFLVNGVKVSL